MTTLREAAQQALEGVGNMEAKQTPLIDLLERVPQDARLVVEHDEFSSSSSHPVGRLCHEAAAALRAALAQPAPEPVAIADGTFNHDCPVGTLLYTAPPQRKPLTKKEIERICMQYHSWRQVVRAVEAAHGMKGEA